MPDYDPIGPFTSDYARAYPYMFTVLLGDADDRLCSHLEHARFATLSEARAFVLGLRYAAGWHGCQITEASRPALEDCAIPDLPYIIDPE